MGDLGGFMARNFKGILHTVTFLFNLTLETKCTFRAIVRVHYILAAGLPAASLAGLLKGRSIPRYSTSKDEMEGKVFD